MFPARTGAGRRHATGIPDARGLLSNCRARGWGERQSPLSTAIAWRRDAWPVEYPCRHITIVEDSSPSLRSAYVGYDYSTIELERRSDERGGADSYAERALAALRAIRAARDPDESERTGREIMEALARTRKQEGRPF